MSCTDADFMDRLGSLKGTKTIYKRTVQGKEIEVMVDYTKILRIEKTTYSGESNPPPALPIEQQYEQWRRGYSANRMYCPKDGYWYWVYFPAKILNPLDKVVLTITKIITTPIYAIAGLILAVVIAVFILMKRRG
jgi:hypothetical protein